MGIRTKDSDTGPFSRDQGWVGAGDTAAIYAGYPRIIDDERSTDPGDAKPSADAVVEAGAAAAVIIAVAQAPEAPQAA